MDQLSFLPEPPDLKHVPFDDIVELYNERCGCLPAFKTLMDARRRSLRARWREDPKRQNLDWWQRYFVYINGVNFLCGLNDFNWRADFDFVIKPSKMIKIIEGHYENEANVATAIASYRYDDVRYDCVVAS